MPGGYLCRIETYERTCSYFRIDDTTTLWLNFTHFFSSAGSNMDVDRNDTVLVSREQMSRKFERDIDKFLEDSLRSVTSGFSSNTAIVRFYRGTFVARLRSSICFLNVAWYFFSFDNRAANYTARCNFQRTAAREPITPLIRTKEFDTVHLSWSLSETLTFLIEKGLR